ncbi:TIGR02679 domain-containing protein [Holdemanella biformis]|uniref:TIGR02679 domain-containing protein n=1 Tax=Holdemanella biformis TaxID=1735 RepID=UPI0026702F93|nr:TIGR02679 domain-containing protein [Holdemanella biformis]
MMNEEFCQYLSDNEFSEFMQLWKKQYEKYGTCKGSIDLVLNDSNRECISGLMGKDYYGVDCVHITFRQLQKAILNTKYENCDFNEVLKMYFNQRVLTNKYRQEQEQMRVQNIFKQFFKQEGKSKQWIYNTYTNRDSVYIRIVQASKENEQKCINTVCVVMKALNHLPMWENKKENISLFASYHTKNPHAFDKNTFAYYLMMHGIVYFLKVDFPKTNLEQNEILYRAGLYQDGISNYCSVARLQAFNENNQPHLGWAGFYDSYEALNVNMDNLLHIHFITCCDRVYIVENPSVFQALLKKIKKEKIEKIGLVCTNGQLNYSAYLLLDILVNSNVEIYYSGDMDPEGLLIADKIKQRYPSTKLWCYDVRQYEISKSKEQATDQRMHMLDALKDEALIRIGKCISENKNRVGYQENMIEEYHKTLY